MNFWTDIFTKLDLADSIKFRIQQKVLRIENIFSNTQQINTKNNYSQHGIAASGVGRCNLRL